MHHKKIYYKFNVFNPGAIKKRIQLSFRIFVSFSHSKIDQVDDAKKNFKSLGKPSILPIQARTRNFSPGKLGKMGSKCAQRHHAIYLSSQKIILFFFILIVPNNYNDEIKIFKWILVDQFYTTSMTQRRVETTSCTL